MQAEAEAKAGAPACLLGGPWEGAEGLARSSLGKRSQLLGTTFPGGSASATRVSDLRTFHLGTGSLTTLAVFALGEGEGQVGGGRLCARALEGRVRATPLAPGSSVGGLPPGRRQSLLSGPVLLALLLWGLKCWWMDGTRPTASRCRQGLKSKLPLPLLALRTPLLPHL